MRTTMLTAWSPSSVTISAPSLRRSSNRWRKCAGRFVSIPRSLVYSYSVLYQVMGLKYDRMKLRHALFNLDSKYKKDKKYSAMESDIDDDFVESWEDECKATDIEKAEKKFAKENEKLAEEGKPAQSDKVLKERIKDIEDKYKALKKERGTGKADPGKKTEEKIKDNIEKLDQRIKQTKLQITDKDAGKEIALGTRWVVRLYSSFSRLTVVYVK